MTVEPATRDGIVLSAQIERELSYYRRECNDLGSRLLRLQEEQSQAFREARRSRTTARLMREAYRLTDTLTSIEAIGGALLEVVIENMMCDRAALLSEEPLGSGLFTTTHVVGLGGEQPQGTTHIPDAPTFFFTTSQTRIESPAYQLTGILKMPYILWAHDPTSGKALIIGNRSESNVSRPFEAGDQELVEGALSVYLDVLARKQAELQLLRAKEAAERTLDATTRFLSTVSGALRTPLNAILGDSEKMSSGSRYPLTIERCAEFADRINESSLSLVAMLNELLDYATFAKVRRIFKPEWRPLSEIVGQAASKLQSESISGARISSRLAGLPVELHVDEVAFGHALRNLVGNSVSAGAGGTAVDVSAMLRDNGTLDIDVLSKATGPDAGLRELALPLVRAMVEVHDGLLTSHGEQSGLIFRITLPPHRVRVQSGARAPD